VWAWLRPRRRVPRLVAHAANVGWRAVIEDPRPGEPREGAAAGEDSPASDAPSGTAPEPVEQSQQAYITLLFNKYRGALHRYLSRLVPIDDAAELVQETYFRLLRHGRMVQLEAMARSFLFQTATNLARDFRRRRGARRADAHVELDEETSGGADFDPGEHLTAEQVLGALERAIGDLPRDTRTVFLLCRFKDMSYPDIAQLMNLSTRTVARKMAEAMEKLGAVVEGLR
jgi:RNA polymerase sigma factor (sigma-70 family)